MSGGPRRRPRVAGRAVRRAHDDRPPSTDETDPRPDPTDDAVVTPATVEPDPVVEPAPEPDPVEASPEPEDEAEPETKPEPESDPKPGSEAPADAARTTDDAPVVVLTPRPTRADVWWLAPLALLAVAAVVAAGVFGVRAYTAASSDTRAAADRDDAVVAASAGAETLATYSFESFESDVDAAAALMTDEYATEYRSEIEADVCAGQPADQCDVEGSLADSVLAQQLEVTGSTIGRASLPCGDDCTDGELDVLVVIEQQRVAAGEPTDPRVLDYVLSMREVDGEWLVDGIRSAVEPASTD